MFSTSPSSHLVTICECLGCTMSNPCKHVSPYTEKKLKKYRGSYMSAPLSAEYRGSYMSAPLSAEYRGSYMSAPLVADIEDLT